MSRVCSAGIKCEASLQQLSNMTDFISGPSEILLSDCSGISMQIMTRLNWFQITTKALYDIHSAGNFATKMIIDAFQLSLYELFLVCGCIL